MSSPNVPDEVVPVLELADAKLVHGTQLGLWVDRGPTMEECIALSSISQDELGHARALYEIVKANGGPGIVALQYDRASSAYVAPAPTLAPRRDWPDVVLSIAVTDRLMLHAIRGLPQASDIVAKIEQEENWHLHHGDAWLATLAEKDETLAELQDALDTLWPAVAHWLHRLPDDVRNEAARDVVTTLDGCGLTVNAAPKGDDWIVEPEAGTGLDELVDGLTSDTRAEIVAMLQDPDSRVLAEAFAAGE